MTMTSQSDRKYPATMTWQGDTTGFLRLIDQTLLPVEHLEIDLETVAKVFEAIRSLRVRGAPAIGCAAASSRPTAVNLFWALDRMRAVAKRESSLTSSEMLLRLLEEARAIELEDNEMCSAIGRHGAPLLKDGTGVLTHCNAGGLATAGDGTALAVIFAAAASGKKLEVFADETRPLLQGARLTAWELQQRGVPVTLICDNMAGWVMREGKVQAVIVGADRITANGDTANKIGTYSVALLAKAHGIPFYVAAPTSTFDLTMAAGTQIPIEQRAAHEITHGFGKQTAPTGINVYNPAFDVTPAEHIAAIITEKGLIQPVTEANVRKVVLS
jgi:methylthioribose-1-phosphate isomerase